MNRLWFESVSWYKGKLLATNYEGNFMGFLLTTQGTICATHSCMQKQRNYYMYYFHNNMQCSYTVQLEGHTEN